MGEVGAISVQSRLSTKVNVQDIRAFLDSPLFDKLNHSRHGLPFVDRISDHRVGRRGHYNISAHSCLYDLTRILLAFHGGDRLIIRDPIDSSMEPLIQDRILVLDLQIPFWVQQLRCIPSDT